MDEAIQVSVHCLAYNHEKYIRKTLEGFVNQKTNFRYKVIIHDDASTDRTPEIIREYEEKYPDIFDVIYQTENQYSQNVDVFVVYMNSRHEGEYVAYCEGDDYWCDEFKLQKQYDALEQNPDAAMCLHRVGLVRESGELEEGSYPVADMQTGCMSSEQFVDVVCSDFFQLSSFFCRKSAYFDYYDAMPEYAAMAEDMGIGDIPLTLYAATYSDKVYFIDEIMSRYRVSSGSSVMRAIWNDREQIRSHYKSMVDMMESFDRHTEGRYHAACKNFREMKMFECFAKQKNIVEIAKNPWCWPRFWKLSLRAQGSIAVKGLLWEIKNKVKK